MAELGLELRSQIWGFDHEHPTVCLASRSWVNKHVLDDQHCFGWVGNELNSCFLVPGFHSQEYQCLPNPAVLGLPTSWNWFLFQWEAEKMPLARAGNFSLFEDRAWSVRQTQAWAWPILSGWLLPIKVLTVTFKGFHHMVSFHTFPRSSSSLPTNQWSSNFSFSLCKLCSFKIPHAVDFA